MAKILSGKQVAEALTAKVRVRADHLSDQGLVPKLVIVRLGEDPSDLAYERGALKRAEAAGVLAERIVLGEETSKEELTGTLRRLSGDETVHGVLLFRPLPAHLKAAEREIVNALDPAKDVDGMTSLSCAGVYEGAPLGFPPCTAQAVIEMLDYYDIQLKGTRAAVEACRDAAHGAQRDRDHLPHADKGRAGRDARGGPHRQRRGQARHAERGVRARGADGHRRLGQL